MNVNLFRGGWRTSANERWSVAVETKAHRKTAMLMVGVNRCTSAIHSRKLTPRNRHDTPVHVRQSTAPNVDPCVNTIHGREVRFYVLVFGSFLGELPWFEESRKRARVSLG